MKLDSQASTMNRVEDIEVLDFEQRRKAFRGYSARSEFEFDRLQCQQEFQEFCELINRTSLI